MPASASSPPQPHAALIGLIRGTYVVTAILTVILLLMVMVALPFGVMFHAVSDVSNPLGYRLTIVFSGLVLILLYGVLLNQCYRKIPKNFWKVNSDTAANFAIVFALLLAVDSRQFLPPHRTYLSYLVSFVFYKLIKSYLFHVLDLNTANPPKYSPPSAPNDTPDEPFVPFNPYDLSKNSPYHPR